MAIHSAPSWSSADLRLVISTLLHRLNGSLQLQVHTPIGISTRIGAHVIAVATRAATNGHERMTYQGTISAAEASKRGVRTMGKTVLIVEDNELNMKLFHDLLDAHGYRTVQTRSGLDALALARLHRPDVILMDIQLPEVSGLEVTKWLKDDDALREIPVIAVTAFAMKGDEDRIRSGGCQAYISKPISVVTFLETVGRFAGAATAPTRG
jgi:two-component system, cell cycle response regulator DivK